MYPTCCLCLKNAEELGLEEEIFPYRFIIYDWHRICTRCFNNYKEKVGIDKEDRSKEDRSFWRSLEDLMMKNCINKNHAHNTRK